MRVCSCETIRNGGSCLGCPYDTGLFYGHLAAVLKGCEEILNEKIKESNDGKLLHDGTGQTRQLRPGGVLPET
jgi:hypothetical protein